jgi:hypothetical protein
MSGIGTALFIIKADGGGMTKIIEKAQKLCKTSVTKNRSKIKMMVSYNRSMCGILRSRVVCVAYRSCGLLV